LVASRRKRRAFVVFSGVLEDREAADPLQGEEEFSFTRGAKLAVKANGGTKLKPSRLCIPWCASSRVWDETAIKNSG
jgi:hypothetical protein